MLMTMRAFNEAARADAVDRLKGDVALQSGDEKTRQADDQMGLLTPSSKAFIDKLRERGDGAAGIRRPRLHSRARHGAVRA
jgi:hypothetical protein